MFKKQDWFVVKEGTNRYGDKVQVTSAKMGKMILSGIAFLILLVIVFGSFGTIGSGERGVKTRFHKIVGTVQPGLYVKLPIFEGVRPMDIQTQKVQEDTTAASSDLQDVKATIAVNFNISPDKVATIFQNIGSDYQEVVIDPAIQETVKAVTAKYTAEQLVTDREAVRQGIVDALTEKLGISGFQVTQVAIVNFAFSDQFNQAIEAKVTAEQNALAAKNKLEQSTYEGQQTIVTAKAQAESIKIQAEAINSQGGADYVQLQAIKAWDGHLPQQFVPGSAIPFINLSK